MAMMGAGILLLDPPSLCSLFLRLEFFACIIFIIQLVFISIKTFAETSFRQNTFPSSL